MECFMENEKNLNSALKDVLNVSIDYLNVVFTVWPKSFWDGNEFIPASVFAFMILGVGFDLMALSEEKGFMDITKLFALMV